MIWPLSLMRPLMFGADITRSSSTMASPRPIFASVNSPKRAAASCFSVKLTAGRLNSSSDGAALRRSLPETTAVFFTA
jgi:hypothetical protein